MRDNLNGEKREQVKESDKIGKKEMRDNLDDDKKEELKNVDNRKKKEGKCDNLHTHEKEFFKNYEKKR